MGYDLIKFLQEELSDQYILVNKKLYKIEDEELKYEDDFFDIKYNGWGNYSYATRFYNGGTCLSEMLEEGLNKLK